MCGPAIVPALQSFMAAVPTISLSATSTLGTVIGTGAKAIATAGTWAAANPGLVSAGISTAGLVDANEKYQSGKRQAKRVEKQVKEDKKAKAHRERQRMAAAARKKKSGSLVQSKSKRPTGRRSMRVG